MTLSDNILSRRMEILREFYLMSPEATAIYVSNQEVIIRRATEQDISAVCNLVSEGFYDVANKYTSVQKFVRNAKSQISKDVISNNACVLVACINGGDNGIIIGCAGVGLNSEVHAEIRHMAVKNIYRGIGLGRKLLQTAMKRMQLLAKIPTRSSAAIERDQEKLKPEAHLSVVSELTSAQSLYTSMGFTEKGRETLKDGCLLIHMTRGVQSDSYY